MTSQPTSAGAGYHPGYWPWGDEPRPVEPTVPMAYERPSPGSRSRWAVLLEVLIAAVVWAAAAAAMGWRVLTSLGTSVPGTDPFSGIWSLAWAGHALHPGSGIGVRDVFEGNAFHPAEHSLAFSDPLLAYAPLTWLVHGGTGLVTLYSLLVVFAPALAALGVYALARQLGAHPVGAAVGAAAFAFAPWHAAQLSHLGALSTGPFVVALAMLARGHGTNLLGRHASPLRPLWALGGWLAAALGLTLGWVNGLPFGYLLAGLAVLVLVALPFRSLRRRRAGRDRRPRAWWLFSADLVGGLAFTAVAGLMAYPFLRVRSLDPAAVESARGAGQLARYSPPPLGLVTPPSVDGLWTRTWSAVMNDALPGVSDLQRWLPGLVLLALAALGLLLSSWRWHWRLGLLLGVAGFGVLALGTRFPLEMPGGSPFELLRHLPGWAGERTPGRLMVLATLALALLAAGAVSRLAGTRVAWKQSDRPARRSRLRGVWVAALVVLPIVVLAEGWVRVPLTAVPVMPTALTRASGPTVVLPSVAADDGRVMFWSTQRGFLPVANGQSGITPTSLTVLRSAVRGFPDAASVAFLRANGYQSVVVLRTVVGGTPVLPVIPDPALNVTRLDLGDSILYAL